MTETKSNADIEPCLSVVMPVYNEAATVVEVIKLVLAQRPVQQMVIVDDASQDGTWEKLVEATGKDARVKLVRHDVNQGQRRGIALHGDPRMGPRPSSSFRTPIWNTTRRNITGCSSRSCPARRTWFSDRGF